MEKIFILICGQAILLTLMFLDVLPVVLQFPKSNTALYVALFVLAIAAAPALLVFRETAYWLKLRTSVRVVVTETSSLFVATFGFGAPRLALAFQNFAGLRFGIITDIRIESAGFTIRKRLSVSEKLEIVANYSQSRRANATSNQSLHPNDLGAVKERLLGRLESYAGRFGSGDLSGEGLSALINTDLSLVNATVITERAERALNTKTAVPAPTPQSWSEDASSLVGAGAGWVQAHSWITAAACIAFAGGLYYLFGAAPRVGPVPPGNPIVELDAGLVAIDAAHALLARNAHAAAHQQLGQITALLDTGRVVIATEIQSDPITESRTLSCLQVLNNFPASLLLFFT